MLRHFFGRSGAAPDHDAVGIEALSCPVVITDISGAISATNPAFERLVDGHRDVLGRHFQPVEPTALVRAAIEKLPQRSAASSEKVCQIVSFDALHLEVTRTVLPGERKRYVLEWRDVSERVALAAGDARRRSLLAAVDRSQPRIVLNLKREVCEVNAELEQLLGYSQTELAGKPHRELFAESAGSNTQADDDWTRVCRGEVVHGEFERRARDGSSVWLLGVYAPVYDVKNQLCCVNAIATDITYQKSLQADVERFLGETRRVMARVSEGDLTTRVEGPFEGDLGDLMGVINNALQALNQSLGRLTAVADHVGTGVEQISGGNSDLRRRTETQVGSLERVAGRLRTITDTVRQNADSAAEANNLAKDAQLRAESGGDVAEKAVDAMAQIDASSQRISDITSVIDSIAFQTNLLALNASVEAARAGEQGRGFAVVAAEVRELAGRSATAAKEIKELIEDASQKVEEGSRLVNDSGTNLLTIVERVQKVTRIVGEIASASAEQSTGVSEVSESIGQMDQMTQKNAALVEEVAAAGFQLKDEANEMAKIVGRFTVSTAPQPAVARQRRTG